MTAFSAMAVRSSQTAETIAVQGREINPERGQGD